MKKTTLMIFIMFNCLAFPALAEEPSEEIEIRISGETRMPATDYKGLGISAGAISGAGFSYRQFFNRDYGFKTSAVIYTDENQTFFNAGIQGLRVLSGNDWLRFYLIGGLSDFSFKHYTYIYEPVPVPEGIKQPEAGTVNGTSTTPAPPPVKPAEVRPPEKREIFDTYLNVGAGIGIEIGRKEQGLSLALELPLVFSFKNFNKLNFIYPIPQVSLIYNF